MDETPPPHDPSDWKHALAEEARRERAARAELDALRPVLAGRVPVGWWEAAFTRRPSPSDQAGHPCGERQMLTLVAYDITEPKRLRRVAEACEDFGVRVQYSVFECRLEADRFDRFWETLQSLIEPKEDKLVAYKICLNCAREIRTAGTMEISATPVAYVF